MKRIDFTLDQLPAKQEGLTLCLGNFDGFHRGHQRLALECRLNALNASAILFASPSYAEILNPETKVLSSLDDKVRYAYSSGLDYAYCLHADSSFFALSPEEFVSLLEELGVASVVVGSDYRFGKEGKGDVSLLKSHFKTYVVPFEKDENGEKISSRTIRALVSQGRIEEAWRDLGRPYEIAGKIVHGLENGRKMGFPTLNLGLSTSYVLPEEGVYAGLVYLNGIPKKAMINVGKNPTVGKLTSLSVEAHVFAPLGEEYGSSAYFAFLKRTRGEKKFESLDELKAQLEQDENDVLSYFEAGTK